MADNNRDEVMIHMLKSLQDRHKDLHSELVQLRTGFTKVIEINCELARQREITDSLVAELELLKNSIHGVKTGLIVPMTLGRGLKWFVMISLTALITIWLNVYTEKAEHIPKQFPHNMDKLVPKKAESDTPIKSE